MSFYENAYCPVCGKQLTDEDDVVTCPVCGTPHHRECYEKLGKCFNEELHKDGFDYYNSIKNNNAKVNKENKSDVYDPAKSEINKGLVPAIPTDNSNANSQNSNANPIANPTTIYTTYDNDPEKIDGKSVSDVALCVGVNAQSFIPKFKQLSRGEKKFKWNWCAFFFGPFYLFFRKMYKAGILFLTLITSAQFVFSALLFKFAPGTMNIYESFLMSQSEGKLTTPEELNAALSGCADTNRFMLISMALMVFLLLINIIIGLVTNSAYKKQIINNINKVEADIESGVKTQNVFMYGMGQMPTDNDLKKLMLIKKGSVSFFAPLIAYFVLEIIITLITAF